MADWNGLDPAYAWTGGAGIIGRLMFHARMVQLGKRKPIGWALVIDLPIALGMGWGVYGLCVWAKLPFEPTMSAGIAAAYLGPYSVDRMFARMSDKYFGEER
jgi:hypothetical protein